MKKLAMFFMILIIIVTGISYMYMNYKVMNNNAQKENKQFESYYNKEIKGTELATIINKAVDINIVNGVTKDKKGKYKNNDNNSINIDIKIVDNNSIYNMEKIYSGEISKFVQYYGEINFKCTSIDYHNSTQKVKYMIFEQIAQ